MSASTYTRSLFIVSFLYICTFVFGQITDPDALMNLIRYTRDHVQPPATDMKGIFWDADLAEMAQTHTDTCKWGFSSDHLKGMVGEAISWHSSSDAQQVLICIHLCTEDMEAIRLVG